MSVSFRDRNGSCGEVTDSLEVNYSGQWMQEVREVVSEIAEDPPDDEATELIIELPEKAPLPVVTRDE